LLDWFFSRECKAHQKRGNQSKIKNFLYEEGALPTSGNGTWFSVSVARRVALHSAVADGQPEAHLKCRPAALAAE
jgi:hypothetical protein